MFTREWIVTSSSLTTCFHSFVQLYFGHNDILPTSFSRICEITKNKSNGAQNTLTRYYIYSPVVRMQCLHTISAATYRIEMKIKKAPNCNLSTKERQELGRTPALFMVTKLRVFNETSGQFTALFLTRCRDDLQPYLRQPKQVFWAKTRSFLSRDQMFLVPAEPLETKLQHFSGFAVFAKLINSMSTNPNTIQKKAVEIQTAGKLRLQSENMSYCVVCRGHCWMLYGLLALASCFKWINLITVINSSASHYLFLCLFPIFFPEDLTSSSHY